MLDEDAWCKNRIQNEQSSNEETRHQEAEGRLDLQEKRKTHLDGFSVYTAIQDRSSNCLHFATFKTISLDPNRRS